MEPKRTAAAVFALVAATACGAETVVHNLDEREANKIIELLAEREIAASKGVIDTGRTINYSIVVPRKSRIDAIKLLNRHEMPRRSDMGYLEVFKESGLIPTSAEEKAKQMAALEGEIEKQLRLVDGILDVQVQLVLPEESALRTMQEARAPTTASVTIKYMPGAGGAKPLSEPQVQAVVAAGVERLTPDSVVVIMTPSGPMVRGGARGDPGEALGAAIAGLPARTARIIALSGVGVIVLLCLVLAYSQISLRTVRGRLMRLQAEIARARRRPESDALPPG